MENKYKYLMKNIGILTISNFSSKILIFLLVPVYTNILTTNEYGVYDLILTTIQLLMPILTVNIYDAVMRYVMESNASKKDICSVGCKYVFISICIFSIFIFLNAYFNIFNVLKNYSGFSILYYIFNLLNQFLTQFTRGIGKVRDVAIAGVCNTLTTLMLNIVLLLYFRLGLNGFFLAYISGQAISAIYLFFKVRFWKYITFRVKKEYEKEMLMYSIPLVMVNLGWWCNNVSDRYVVTLLCGIAVNGIYSVSYKIPTILTILQQIFIQAWQISAVKEYEDTEAREFFGKTFDSLNILMCLFCMGLILFTKPLAKILYAKDFYEAWRYVPFLLVSGVFNSASGVLGPILSAHKNAKALGVSSLLGAVINLILNFVLVYFMGAQGAAIATACSSYAIYEFRKRAVGNAIEYSKYRKTILSWIFIVGQSIIAIYTNWDILQIVIIVLFILSNKSKIIYLCKKARGLIRV